jgi:hypothetical protein
MGGLASPDYTICKVEPTTMRVLVEATGIGIGEVQVLITTMRT